MFDNAPRMNWFARWPLGRRVVLLIAFATLAAGCNGKSGDENKPAQGESGAKSTAPPAPVSAAPPSAPAPTPKTSLPVKALNEVESLVAPIALYPDPLLAEMLVASTYPLEVVQAARWLESNPDPKTLSAKDWDASVMRLTEVPSIIKMMNDHLDWTTQLGDSFLAKPDDVMAAVQSLRKRASEGGFLKDTPEQKIVRKAVAQGPAPAGEWLSAEPAPAGQEAAPKAQPAVMKTETISIQPAQADKLYVPQYNPETVYAATMSPPPSAVAYQPAGGATYYPTNYPPPAAAATSQASNYDAALTFGAGALVGGLLTWAIMESNHNDNFYGGWYGYPIVHPYGNAVCRYGNCWSGGGYGGYRGNVNIDRGNINRNVNISGNEINVDRNGFFKQGDLNRINRPAGWTPDLRHRRGETLPAEARDRLGQIQSPPLAGQRPGAAQNLPADARGFARPGTLPARERPSVDQIREGLAQRPGAGTLPAERRDFARPDNLPAQRRPSSAEIREGLAERQGGESNLRRNLQGSRPATQDLNSKLADRPRPSAFDDAGESGRQALNQSQRGMESRRQNPDQARGGFKAQQDLQSRRESAGALGQRRTSAETPARSFERPAGASPKMQRPSSQGVDRSRPQGADFQRRAQSARPSAFDGARNPGGAQSFSQRGAASRQSAGFSGFGGNARAARGGGGGGFAGRGGGFGGGGGGGGGFRGGAGGGGRGGFRR